MSTDERRSTSILVIRDSLLDPAASFWYAGRDLPRLASPMSIRSDPRDWSDPRQRVGVEGEEEAKRYLVTRGFTILAHRWRMGRCEIDLVARRGALVIFVEVKTRWGGGFGSPLEAVTWAKRREIVRVARAWMDRHGSPSDIYRFDVIGLRRDLTDRRLEHVEDAFTPGWR